MNIALYLSDQIKITKASAYASANTTDVVSDEIDMAGYDGILWVTNFGTANAGNLITHHDAATTTAEAATVAHVHSGSSDEVCVLDILHPQRFCKCVASRGASTTLGEIYAIQYKGRTAPITNAASGTLALLKADSPAAA